MVCFWEISCKLNCKESQGLLFCKQKKKNIGFEPILVNNLKHIFRIFDESRGWLNNFLHPIMSTKNALGVNLK